MGIREAVSYTDQALSEGMEFQELETMLAESLHAKMEQEEAQAWDEFTQNLSQKSTWFKSSIEFKINGAAFSGRKDHQVKAGVVPLFKGGYLDLRKARLKGVSGGKGKGMAEGDGGILMLSPKGTSQVHAIRLGHLTIREDQGISGSVFGDFIFMEPGEEKGRIVHADRIKLNQNNLYITEVTESTLSGIPTVKIAEGKIDETGIHPDVSADTQNKAAAARANAGTAASEPAQASAGATASESAQASAGTAASAPAQAPAASPAPEQIAAARHREELLEAAKKSAYDKTTSQGESADRAESQEEPQEEEAAEITVETKAGVGAGVSADKISVGFAKELGSINGEDDKNAVGLGKLGKFDLNTDYLQNFQDFINNNVQKEEEKEISITLAEVPILPFLEFAVKIKPKALVQFTVNGSLENYRSFFDLAGNPDKTPKFTFEAALTGALSIGLEAALEAGVPGLISLEGGVTAAAGVEGADDNHSLLKASGEVEFGLGEKNNFPIMSDAVFKVGNEEGLSLFGEVTAGISAKSPLIGWEKDIWEYTFGRWVLENPKIPIPTFEITKKAGTSITKGWDIKETGGLTEFKDQFLNKYPEKGGLGLKPLKKKRYDDMINQADKITESYDSALKTLLEIRKYKNIYISDDGGFAGFLKLLMETESRFHNIKLDTYINFLKQDQSYEEIATDSRFQKTVNNFTEGENRHQGRVDKLKDWAEHPENYLEGVMELYTSMGGGFGFRTTLRAIAESEFYTWDNIMAYEQRQVEDREQGYNSRIEELERQQPGERSESTAEEKKHLSVTRTPDQLIQYEQERLDSAQKEAADLLNALTQKCQDLQIDSDEKKAEPNEAFAQYYQSLTKKSKNLKFRDFSNFTDIGMVIEYEESRFKEKDGDLAESLAALEAARALLESGQKTEREALALFLDGAGPSGSDARKNLLSDALKPENRYRLYSIDDLIQYEERELQKEPGQLKDRLMIMEKAREENLNVSGKYDGWKKDARKDILKTSSDWVKEKKTGGKLQENVKQLLTLEMLLEYEMGRFRDIKATRKGVYIKREEHISKHQKRIELLQKHISVRDRFPEGSRQRREAEIKLIEQYSDSEEAGKSTIDGFVDKFTQAPENQTRIAIAAVNEQLGQIQKQIADSESVENSPAARVNTLKRAKEQRTPMSQVWEYYKESGGSFLDMVEKGNQLEARGGTSTVKQSASGADISSAGFQGAARLGGLKRAENLTIGELINYVESNLSDDGGLHLERQRIMSRYKDSNLSPEEFLDKYKNDRLLSGDTMDGGKRFKKHISLTPGIILKAVEAKKAELGQKHSERLQSLNQWKSQGMSNEAINAAYQTMARETKFMSSRRRIGLDEYLEKQTDPAGLSGADTLTREEHLEFARNQRYVAGLKHRQRLEILQNNTFDKEERVRQYRETEARGFFRSVEMNVRAREEELTNIFFPEIPSFKESPLTSAQQRNDDASYQMLLNYEQNRLAFMTEGKADAGSVLKEIEDRRAAMTKQDMESQTILDAIEEAKKAVKQPGANAGKVIDNLINPLIQRVDSLKLLKEMEESGQVP